MKRKGNWRKNSTFKESIIGQKDGMAGVAEVDNKLGLGVHNAAYIKITIPAFQLAIFNSRSFIDGESP